MTANFVFCLPVVGFIALVKWFVDFVVPTRNHCSKRVEKTGTWTCMKNFYIRKRTWEVLHFLSQTQVVFFNVLHNAFLHKQQTVFDRSWKQCCPVMILFHSSMICRTPMQKAFELPMAAKRLFMIVYLNQRLDLRPSVVSCHLNLLPSNGFLFVEHEVLQLVKPWGGTIWISVWMVFGLLKIPNHMGFLYRSTRLFLPTCAIYQGHEIDDLGPMDNKKGFQNAY